jgi:hypothetical protein
MGGQVRVERLEHHPLTGRDGAQSREVGTADGSGVDVRQQAGLGKDEPGGVHHIVDRRGETPFGKPARGDRIAVLGCLSEGEQRLMAPCRRSGARDGQDLVLAEIGRRKVGRRLRERAVPTPVTAQHRERNEDLR